MSNKTHIAYDVLLIPDIHRVVLTIAYSIVAALGVPANLMILIIIIWNKKLRQLPLNQYIVTLAFTDLLTCGISAPFYIFSLNVVPNSDVLQNGVLCKGFLTVTYSTGMLTVSALAALSMDRWLAIIKPYIYCKYITSEKVCILNICLLLQVILTMLPATIIKGYIVNNNVQGLVCIFRTDGTNIVYSSYVIAVNVVLPLLAITLCNTVVFKVAREQYKKIKVDGTQQQENISKCAPSVIANFSEVESVKNVYMSLNQGENQNNSRNEIKIKNATCFEITHFIQGLCTNDKATSSTAILSAANQNFHNRKAFKEQKSKNKEKDLKSSISRFKFQYRIYISTLSMIILLFIFWSPFPVIRVLERLGYNEQMTQYGFLYSTLGTTILSLINPFVIFITRREFQKYTCFKRKITTR
ncbi:somatostatin receptor type 2-like [Hydractinia symbiolongicarpus]|uniref:somatostatin receptor type 2-like n=1 Tax=Hydractinia symbiolongicarpus TaxID=13093 RepID=UPI00254A2E77|nr:somatostatin receptor type 2-like [Hydractinia symbiolongicarpus]